MWDESVSSGLLVGFFFVIFRAGRNCEWERRENKRRSLGQAPLCILWDFCVFLFLYGMIEDEEFDRDGEGSYGRFSCGFYGAFSVFVLFGAWVHIERKREKLRDSRLG